jgi:hypothetical protein
MEVFPNRIWSQLARIASLAEMAGVGGGAGLREWPMISSVVE